MKTLAMTQTESLHDKKSSAKDSKKGSPASGNSFNLLINYVIILPTELLLLLVQLLVAYISI